MAQALDLLPQDCDTGLEFGWRGAFWLGGLGYSLGWRLDLLLEGCKALL